jgi:tripartite-type tricarboxylate transporter receptor subunit TctC
MISVIRTGGGGVVGADYVLKSAADGHVMLFGDPNLNSLRPQVEQLSFSVGDFIPVARINYRPNSNSSSTCRLRRRLASTYHRRCSPAQMR